MEFHRSWIPAGNNDTSADAIDYIVLGSDIGSLFTAAVLGRCGFKVFVLERGAVVGQCVMPRGGSSSDIDEDVVVGDHCLHGSAVQELAMLTKVMQPDLAPEWRKVLLRRIGGSVGRVQ